MRVVAFEKESGIIAVVVEENGDEHELTRAKDREELNAYLANNGLQEVEVEYR